MERPATAPDTTGPVGRELQVAAARERRALLLADRSAGAGGAVEAREGGRWQVAVALLVGLGIGVATVLVARTVAFREVPVPASQAGGPAGEAASTPVLTASAPATPTPPTPTPATPDPVTSEPAPPGGASPAAAEPRAAETAAVALPPVVAVPAEEAAPAEAAGPSLATAAPSDTAPMREPATPPMPPAAETRPVAEPAVSGESLAAATLPAAAPSAPATVSAAPVLPETPAAGSAPADAAAATASLAAPDDASGPPPRPASLVVPRRPAGTIRHSAPATAPVAQAAQPAGETAPGSLGRAIAGINALTIGKAAGAMGLGGRLGPIVLDDRGVRLSAPAP